jgi:NhaA family Na+:H+ antiporter
MKATKLFKEFFEKQAGGLVLIACTIISLALSNSIFGPDYQGFSNQINWFIDRALDK